MGLTRRYWLAVILLAVISLVLFLPPGSGIGPASAKGEKPLGRLTGLQVTAITDADSLRAGPLRLRLFGVDAPEIRQNCADRAGQTYPCGKMARDWLAEFLPKGAELSCDLLDQDRYGRLVTRCFYQGRDIAAQLVAAGWALAWQLYSEDYMPVQARASAKKAGLWAGQFETPWDWRRNQRK